MRGWTAVVLAFALLVSAAPPAVAQSALTTLTVINGSAPLVGVKVSVVSRGGTLIAFGTTDGDGRVGFQIPKNVEVNLRIATPEGRAETPMVARRDCRCARPTRCSGRVEIRDGQASVKPAG